MRLLQNTSKWLLMLGWVPTLAIVGYFMFQSGAASQAQERTPIKITRIYTGDDGQTHAEDYQVPLTPQNDGSSTELAAIEAAESIQFRRTSPQYFIDWHPAPRKQYVITLSGESEVELGDGSKIRLYPGHILLAEDTTGQGHISRAIGDADRISVFVPLQ